MKISGISLILSCDCNLNCSYCHLNTANALNKNKAITLQKNTLEALSNGEFLKNVKNTLKMLNQDPLNIKALDFWGQETTLSLGAFSDHAEEWFETFPNIKSLLFSTNGTTDPLIIFNYIKKINSLAKRENSVELKIQFSYDGEWSTKQLRGADPALIKNNLKTLLEMCKKEDLNNVFLSFAIHGVFSKTLFYYLKDNKEKLLEYEKDFKDFCWDCRNLISNYKNYNIGLGIAGELPFDGSSQDGKDIAKLMRNYFEDADFKKEYFSPLLSLSHYYLHGGAPGYKSSTEFEQILKNVVFNPESRENWGGNLYCGANYKNLKIMYDGTLLQCQNCLFDDNYYTNSILTKKQSIFNSMLDHHHQFNVLKDDPISYEEILKINEAMSQSYFIWGVHQCATLMISLAKAGQIKEEYLTDQKKLLTDALFLASKNVCHYNYEIATGSYFLKDSGFIRLYCNGLMDVVREYVDQGGIYAHL